MNGVGGINGHNKYPVEDNTQPAQVPTGKTRSGRKVQKFKRAYCHMARTFARDLGHESTGFMRALGHESTGFMRELGHETTGFMRVLGHETTEKMRATTRPLHSRRITKSSERPRQVPGLRGNQPQQQPVNNSSKVDQPVAKDPLRGQWFDWSAKQFQGKGYAPHVAKTMADTVLSRCGSDYRAVEVMVNSTPLSPQAAFRQEQQKNYQWAMGQFTAKGYDPDHARQAITDALSMAGTNLTDFQRWVVAAPDVRGSAVASPEYIKNELRPWMIQEIEKKGFAPAEAQAVADNLIELSTGNVDELRQSVQEIRPKDARPQVPANEMEQRNEEALETLGLTKDASLNDVKKAYRKLALKHHPDKNSGNVESNQFFKKISEAHRHLTEDSNLFKN